MLQECFFRLARVVGDLPAKIIADLRLFWSGLSENRIDDLGHLPAQGVEILLVRTQLVEGSGLGAFHASGPTEFQHLGVRSGGRR